MKSKSSPNEIFIGCFEYLNGLDIIHAFDQLYYRFQILIQIKQQIYSLKLPNSPPTCKQMQTFLSLFSLNQFSPLRSLTLNKIDTDNIENIPLTFLSVKRLEHFSFNFQSFRRCNLLLSLPSLTIKRLSMSVFCSNPPIEKIPLITHLTVDQCYSSETLFQFIKFTPMLKYLKINDLSAYNHKRTNNSVQLIYLTTLILNIKYRPKVCERIWAQIVIDYT